MERLPQVHRQCHPAAVGVRDDVGRHVRVPRRQRLISPGGGLHRGPIGRFQACFGHQTGDGISQARRQTLRRLAHHAVPLELEVGALVENDLEGEGRVFQASTRGIETIAASQNGLRQRTQLVRWQSLQMLDDRFQRGILVWKERGSQDHRLGCGDHPQEAHRLEAALGQVLPQPGADPLPLARKVRGRISVLQQRWEFTGSGVLGLLANLAHLLQRMSQHLSDGVLQGTGVGCHPDVGQGGRRQEEAAHVHVTRPDAAVPPLVTFAFLSWMDALDYLADRLERIEVGGEKRLADVAVRRLEGMVGELGRKVVLAVVPFLVARRFLRVRR